MPVTAAYLDFVVELLSPLGPISTRRMFGGRGIYLHSTLFGFVVDDTLHFKVDDQTRRTYQAEGSGPFTYQTQAGTQTLTSYWRAPERLFDEPDEMLEFARMACASSVRTTERKLAAKQKPPGKTVTASPKSVTPPRRRTNPRR
jgi:DNA transformation protein and related proteins